MVIRINNKWSPWGIFGTSIVAGVVAAVVSGGVAGVVLDGVAGVVTGVVGGSAIADNVVVAHIAWVRGRGMPCTLKYKKIK